MLKKSYLLVAFLSFMSMNSAFSMEDEGNSSVIDSQEQEQIEGEDPKPTTPTKSPDQEEDATAESKKAPPKSAKSSKKRSGWCCFSRTNDDD
ncbi:MAG: hypothetical protein K2W92_03720 [Alphaproteobacteria bacterium]|nr:hypothetical protein [Alphaproteobacteria bacterium]